MSRSCTYQVTSADGTAATGSNAARYISSRASGILRYSYATPDFITGSLLCEARPTPTGSRAVRRTLARGHLPRSHPCAHLPLIETDHSSYNAHGGAAAKHPYWPQKLRTMVGTKACGCGSPKKD